MPLVINLTGSVWFFLLVGKEGLWLFSSSSSFGFYFGALALVSLGGGDWFF